MTEKSTIDFARKCGAAVPEGPFGGIVAFSIDQLTRFAASIRTDERVALAATPDLPPPAGFALVPIEPTPEMIGAMAVVDASGKINGVPSIGMSGACEAYEAMLAAAPRAPIAQPLSDGRLSQLAGEFVCDAIGLMRLARAIEHAHGIGIKGEVAA